jgi:hypothetical protein
MDQREWAPFRRIQTPRRGKPATARTPIATADSSETMAEPYTAIVDEGMCDTVTYTQLWA